MHECFIWLDPLLQTLGMCVCECMYVYVCLRDVCFACTCVRDSNVTVHTKWSRHLLTLFLCVGARKRTMLIRLVIATSNESGDSHATL